MNVSRSKHWLCVALLCVSLAGCGRSVGEADVASKSTDPAGLVDVTLQLNWFPEAEHGGFFAALVEGYYREAGLNVKILPGGPETPVIQQVARGAATFGVVNADNVLFGRAQQAPVVALMAPLQNSPRCIMVHASSGIDSFDELKNMTISMSNSNAFSQYLIKNLPLTGVKVVPYTGSVAMFLQDQNYAQQAYNFSEPFIAKKEGGDPKLLMVSELGFNPYTSLLFTSERQTSEAKDVVAKMTAASIKGWAKYIESPDKTNEYIHSVNPQIDLDILDFGAKTLAPLVLDAAAKEHGIGTMARERWQKLNDQLVESDQPSAPGVDVDKAFTTEFLHEQVK